MIVGTLLQNSVSTRERMNIFAFLSLFVLLQACCVDAGEYCPYHYSYSSLYTTRWCSYGCCHDKYYGYDDVCCSGVPVIAGSVGGLIAIGIVIGVIVCCVQSYNRKRGVIIHPINAPQTVVVQGTTTAYGAYPVLLGPPAYPNQVTSTTVITS